MELLCIYDSRIWNDVGYTFLVEIYFEKNIFVNKKIKRWFIYKDKYKNKKSSKRYSYIDIVLREEKRGWKWLGTY